ncbi:hypothetical protein FQR65_LT12921 [Abscondita terminalis]|nr:hypothetical protein FQR65_LT12921 [Abscondita terminalis]
MRFSSWNSSYVYGIDNESGWGERYFFTYFGEFGERTQSAVIAEVTMFTLLFAVSVFANVSIAICVFRFSDILTATNCFVLNLVAADLMFALSIPAVAYTRIVANWVFGDVACRFISYTQFVSGIVLLWTLCLISVDRYRSVVVPPYRSKIKPKQASIYAVITWILASLVLMPLVFWFRQLKIERKIICTLIFPKSETINYSFIFAIPLPLIACLLPMMIIVYNYQRIFRKIFSTRNAWASSCVAVGTIDMANTFGTRDQIRRQSKISITTMLTPWPRKFSSNTQFSGGGRQGSLSQHEELRLNKHIRVLRLLLLNVVVVLCMWLPIILVLFLIFIDARRSNDDIQFFMRSKYFIVGLIIALLNTVINPLLYGLLSDNFGSCFLQHWCFHRRIKNIKENATPTNEKDAGCGSSKT